MPTASLRGYPAVRASSPSLTDRYGLLLALGLAGYVVFGKGFAYLGASPLFVGEILFGLGLLALLASGCTAGLFATPPALCLAALIGWVLVRTLPFVGGYGTDALRDSVVATYGGFAFVVIALLIERPERLERVVRYFGILATRVVPAAIVAYVFARFAKGAIPNLPGTGVPIVEVRPGELAAHLCGAIVFVILGFRRVGLAWIAVALLATLMVGAQSRGAMLAILVPIGLAMVLAGQLRRLIAVVSVMGLLLAAAYTLDAEISEPGSQRPLSARSLVNNFGSIFTNTDEGGLDGTKAWRLRWWAAIRGYTFDGPYFWTGKGFGPNLAEVDGFVVGLEHGGPVLRSPHSVHMTYLARSGVPGLALWALFCTVWVARLLLDAAQARRGGQERWARLFVFLVCYVLSIVIDASFDVALEGPMLGIWLWVLVGTGIGASMIYRASRTTTATSPAGSGSRPAPAPA